MQFSLALLALSGTINAWKTCVPTNYEDYIPPSERTNPAGTDHICWKQVSAQNMCELWMKCHYDVFGIGANPRSAANTASWCPKTCNVLNKFFPKEMCTSHHRMPIIGNRWVVDEVAKTACYSQPNQPVKCVSFEGEIVSILSYGSPVDGDLLDIFEM